MNRPDGAAPVEPGRVHGLPLDGARALPLSPISLALRRLPLALTAAIAVAVAGWGFSRVIEPDAATVPVLLGALGPAQLLATAVVLGSVVSRRPPSPALTLPLLLLAGVTIGPVVASALAPGPGPVQSLREFGGVWRTLLTSTLPAIADAPTLLAVLLLVWVAATFAVEAALRSTAAVTALVPAVLVLAVAVAFGLPAGGRGALPHATALALVAGVHLGLARVMPAPGRSQPDVPAAPDRVSALLRTGAVVVVALLAAGVGLVAGPRLPFADARAPFDPRVLVEPPDDSSRELSALSRVSQWLAEPPRPLLAVAGDLDLETDRLRLVSLEEYDGRAWTGPERYVVAGARLPAGPATSGSVRTLHAEIGLGALPGQWLPAPDRARSIDGFVAKVAPQSGDLVSAGQPLAGARYSVTSEVRTPVPDRLLTAGAGADPKLDPMRSLPADRPDVLAATAREAAGAGTTPIQQLLLLEQWMRQRLEYDPGALPGHSLGLLERFVEPGSSGTLEQFAAAYAVLARELGFASRVTVGFTAGTAADDPARMAPVDTGSSVVLPEPLPDNANDQVLDDPASLLGAGARTVTTRDALAWPEVWLDGAGWVAFYPVPTPGAGQEQDVVSGVGAPPDRVDLEDVGTTAPQDVDRQPDLVETPERASTARQLLLALAAATGALALWVGLASLWRTLRRRRRRATGTPRERLLRAWRDALNALDAAGVRRVRTLTADEVVQQGGAVLGDVAVPHLAALADAARRALFSTRDVSSADADLAWDDAEAVRVAALRTRGRAGRAVDLLVPRA